MEVMVLSAFSPPEKGARRVAETVSNPLRTPANLIPCPYVPRIANEPSTWPITVHCETSKTHSLHRTTISAFSLPSLLRYSSRPSISSFLTIRIPHGTLQNNGVAGGRTNHPSLNARPCIFIFRNAKWRKKNRTIYDSRIFHFFLQHSTFLLKNFYSSRFYRILRIYYDLK